ncbi:MAG: hypothetical protein IPK88_07565 [Saprospiraceae bacterium]|nr:hypothetical protein [Candidatus Defluviibacterium haderslevense]
MKISEQLIHAAKEVPLLEIVELYVQLKPYRNGYQGLCPFHKERTPSFFVTPGRGYKCFGCGAKGRNAIDFIIMHNGTTFIEAVNEVLNLAGIQVLESENFYQNKILGLKKTTTDKEPLTFSHIPNELVNKSIQIDQNGFQISKSNNFVEFLIHYFGSEVASQLVSKYCIGSSKHRFKHKDYPNYESQAGATIFWQKDINGKVRTGKIMLYNTTTGKRIKEPFSHISMVHSSLKLPDFELRQCLFGEYLLFDKSKPVAIVESEKTAIIASVYFPQFIWLATGGLENLTYGRCKVLKGRKVILFPDLNGYENWTRKAKEFSDIGNFEVNDYLEKKAIEFANEHNIELAELRKEGFDLTDVLMRINYKEFNRETSKPPLIIETFPESVTSEVDNIIQIRTIPAYVSGTGELYIETPIGTTYTIYPSIDHYNNRLCLPEFIDKDKISIDEFKVVQINLDLLKIIIREDCNE